MYEYKYYTYKTRRHINITIFGRFPANLRPHWDFPRPGGCDAAQRAHASSFQVKDAKAPRGKGVNIASFLQPILGEAILFAKNGHIFCRQN